MQVLCKACGQHKERDEFHFKNESTRRPRYASRCKACLSENTYDWYHNRGGREHMRKKVVFAKYGLTPEAYDELLIKQNGECGICRVNLGEQKMQPSVDHCHKTNKVRGLLCNNCNRGLGLLGDTLDDINRAVSYLKLFNEMED